MRVAIIGGGFSGTALSAELLKRAQQKLSVFLIEKSDHLGQGTAFSTPYPWHLLNVRARDMGAFADRPDDFYQWLVDHENAWRALDPLFQTLPLSPNHFMPRMVYHRYLQAVLKDSKRLADERGHLLHAIHREVIDIQSANNGKLHILFSDREPLEVDKAVLACGTKATKTLARFPINAKCVEDIWACRQGHIEKHVSKSHHASVLVVLGTGLTMVDLVTTLKNLEYPGKIVALSHHGHLPLPLDDEKSPYIDFQKEMLQAPTLLKKLGCFRKKLKIYGNDTWPHLIDSLRSYTQELWQQLSQQDRRRFLRHLIPYWNIHRHRIPQESHQLILQLQEKHQLTLLTGNFMSAEKKGDDRINIHYTSAPNTLAQIEADFLYNCTGPDYHLSHSPHVLLHTLLEKKSILPDILDLGIKCDPTLRCEGPLKDHLFAIGPLLFGQEFEITSVPDIRTHASIIALKLVSEV